MSKFSICQTGYPKILLPGSIVKDTLVAITRIQAIATNQEHNSLLESKEVIDSQTVVIDTCRKYIRLAEHSDSLLKEGIKIKDETIGDQSSVLNKIHITVDKQDKEIRKLRKFKSLAFISTSTLIIVITYLILI